jgi:hypothetical protein
LLWRVFQRVHVQPGSLYNEGRQFPESPVLTGINAGKLHYADNGAVPAE